MSHSWFASIELAVCKQSVLSRGIFPGEVLLGVLSCSVLIHILETGLCVALFSPFYSHWETSFLILSMLSCQDGSFLPEGAQNPGILLLSLAVTLTRDQHISCICPMLCSSELPASVIWSTQMYSSALLCRSGETLHCKRCRVKELGDLPWESDALLGLLLLIVLLWHWKTKFTSWASDTIWIFILSV